MSVEMVKKRTFSPPINDVSKRGKVSQGEVEGGLSTLSYLKSPGFLAAYKSFYKVD